MKNVTGTALERFIEVVDSTPAQNAPVVKRGKEYRTSCLAHGGEDSNLAIAQGDKGVVLTCFSHGCSAEDIAEAYGLNLSDLFDNSSDSETLRQRKIDLWMPCQGRQQKDPCSGHKASENAYRDEAGNVLYYSCRCSRKGEGCKTPFAYWQPDPFARYGKKWNLEGVRLVIYRLPEVLKAVTEGKTIYIVEGEKDADRLASMGLEATSAPMGAGKWRAEYAAWFLGAKVVVIADRDTKGFDHAVAIYNSLFGVAESIEVVMAAVNREKSDVSDHLNAGFTMEQLLPAKREKALKPVDPIPEENSGSLISPEVEALLRSSSLDDSQVTDLPGQPEDDGFGGLSALGVPKPRTAESDEEIERTVLGSMIFSSRMMPDAMDTLEESDFTSASHEAVFTALRAMYAASIPVDTGTLGDTMSENGSLRLIGSRDFLRGLERVRVDDKDHFDQHLEILKKRSIKRRINQVMHDWTIRNLSDQWDPEDLVQQVTTRLQDTLGSRRNAEKLSVADYYPEYAEEMKNGDTSDILKSPWPRLNSIISFKPGNLMTVGAGTSVGKSLFAGQWASYIGFDEGLPVLIFSMEMGVSELLNRFHSERGNIDLRRLSDKDLKGTKFAERMLAEGNPPGNVRDFTPDFDRLAPTMLSTEHVHVRDNGFVTTSKIRAEIRRMIAMNLKPELVVVDYIQLIEADKKSSDDAKALAGVSRDLKIIAQEYETRVLSIAQFNREMKGREPRVEDFKGSSSIEQDSNIIVLLHSDIDPESGKVIDGSNINCNVAKNRNGPLGQFSLVKMGHYSKMVEPGRAS